MEFVLLSIFIDKQPTDIITIANVTNFAMSQSAAVESNSLGLLSKPEVGNTGSLSAEEAKLYDRQIRLWGVDAQRRMRDSRVLLVGFGSLNAEVCKNLVLAGINHVTILETHTATPEDLGAHIFLEPSHIGSNVSLTGDHVYGSSDSIQRASACVENIKLLNPTATIAVVEGNVESQTDDFFKSFTVACATNCMLTSLVIPFSPPRLTDAVPFEQSHERQQPLLLLCRCVWHDGILLFRSQDLLVRQVSRESECSGLNVTGKRPMERQVRR